jgi:hypothetical protein
MATLILVGTASSALAKDDGKVLPFTEVNTEIGPLADRPVQSIPSQERGGIVDTASYGDLGPGGFSIFEDIWDWDNPDAGGDPLMGWYATDMSQQPTAYGRRLTESIWDGNQNPPSAPLLVGAGLLWMGVFENEADALCWEAGLGYANNWCQRLISPTISLTSANNVSLSFRYFNDTEPDFDYTHIILRRLPSGDETALSPFEGLDGKIGLNTPETNPPVGADYVGQITTGALGGSTQFQLIFEMNADALWSDEDGDYATEYGPFGVDNIVMSGGATQSYQFESTAEGWTFQQCPGFGHQMNLGHRDDYQIADPCGCDIAGNLLEFHDDDFVHPYGQQSRARSNPTNVVEMRTHLDFTPQEPNLEVFADWDMYTEMPRANGGFYRPGWDYFPFICVATGAIGWSDRQGQDVWFSSDGPVCFRTRNSATLNGVPNDVEQIRFVFELTQSCDLFGITDCTFTNNFTPLVDNVEVRGTPTANAPAIQLAGGLGVTYQDGFIQNSVVLNPNGLGRADVSYRAGGPLGNDYPIVLGDSLEVEGPIPTTSTKWEARMWFKVRREGPGVKPARYTDWKNDVDAINGNPQPTANWCFVWMDSAQNAQGAAFKQKFINYAREDNLYPGEVGELTEGNEIIRDDVIVAGTAFDYFFTSNYDGIESQSFYLPDTTGGFYLEFEILPSWRVDAGTNKFPCLLYVDCNSGSQTFIEAAFDELGLDRDRYDYGNATSNYKPAMARGAAPSNNGTTVPQLLGYRGIVVNTGALPQAMWGEDFNMFSDWLNSVICGGTQRQGFILNGDDAATVLVDVAPAFLGNILGAIRIRDNYYDGGDENYCVQLEVPLGGGAKYGTVNSQSPGGYDYDAWGNWCPEQFKFDVVGTTNGGVGNRSFVNLDGGDTDYAQVAREVGGAANYRTVIDGVSYHHQSERDAVTECEGDSAHVVSAALNELASALEWVYGSAAAIPRLCIQPCNVAEVGEESEVTDARVTRLYQSSPNPFNLHTTLRFSLAQTGRVELTIFDVNGRKVRSLVDEQREAGLHEVAWDGTDDAGRPVTSGVFWSQLQTEGFTSNKKMVVLK